jgi:hypothetical protein
MRKNQILGALVSEAKNLSSREIQCTERFFAQKDKKYFFGGL